MAFKLKSSGSYYVTFDDSGLTANRKYILPDSDGSLGGSSFTLNSPSTGRILLSDGTTNAATASTNISWDSGNETLTITNGGIEQTGIYTSTFAGDIIVNGVSRFTDVEERELTVTIGGTPSSLSLDLSQANVFEVTYNNNVNSFSIINPPLTNYAGSFTLVTTGTGVPYPWNWGSAVTWSGGSAPSVTATNGKKDIYGFISTNQGTNWYGFIGGQNL
jgi:hypothetical protein